MLGDREADGARVAELLTRAIGLINEALDIEFKPFNVTRQPTPEELDRVGFAETCERMRPMERARADLLRAMATSAERAKELAESWGIIYDEPHGHMRATLDQ